MPDRMVAGSRGQARAALRAACNDEVRALEILTTEDGRAGRDGGNGGCARGGERGGLWAGETEEEEEDDFEVIDRGEVVRHGMEWW